MKTSDEIKKILKDNKEDLNSRFNVKTIGIFGSYAREENDEISDLDILVEFHTPIDYFEFLELEDHLSQLTGIKVDLVEKLSLKPFIGRHIIQEAIMI